MRAIPIVGVAALALAACQAEDTAQNNSSDVTSITEDEGGSTELGTTDLNLDAGAGEVGQAINQTDSQSELDNSVEQTTDSVGNQM